MSVSHAHVLPFGAQVLAEGRVRFRIWAPAQGVMTLAIEGEPPRPMHAAGGWHELTVACGAGARYRYVLEDGTRIPDPASRFQPHDVHGPSEVIDARAYPWMDSGWPGRPWKESVVYELHVGLCGGYAGVERLLPALAKLGITVVELMPLSDFPGTRNWGYDGVLPYAPDSSYGTPRELKRLVEAAHALGLCLMLDVVYNHFGPDGNYLARYAPGFFHKGEPTPWGDAIDFARPEVRDYFIQNALYWLREYRFDGLRLDAVHAIGDRTFVPALAKAVRETIAREEPGRVVHLVLENEHNDAAPLESLCDAQWNDDWHNAMHVLLTGETHGYYAPYRDCAAEKLARCMGEGFGWQGEVMSIEGKGRSRGTPSAHLPPCAFVAFLQNHDQTGNRAFGERLEVLTDPETLHAARLLLLLSPHIPLLFMGQDCASRAPFFFFTDFTGDLARAVREGRQREFSSFAAHADRLPDPNALSTYEQSRPDLAEDSERCRTRRAQLSTLLALRREHLVPWLEQLRAEGTRVLGKQAVTATWRRPDGARWRVAANFGAAEVAWTDAPASRAIYSAGAPLARAGMLAPRSGGAWLERDGE